MVDNYAKHIPKCVMITGATGGFGAAFAHRFAKLGCHLVLHGRNEAKLDALISDLSKYNAPTHKIIFDITNKNETRTSIESIPNGFKNNIDVLINNAGGALGLDKFHGADLDDLESMIEMNNTSLVRITHQILPQMVKNKCGHIINIGSSAGNWPYAGGSVYCAVKAFVKQFSLALRSDLIGTSVRVTNIEPANTETPFALARFKGDVDKAAAVYANTTPLTAQDIAESVVWAACLPSHVNINTMEVMPTKQSFSPLHIERNG